MVSIYTAQYRYSGKDRMDVTVKSASGPGLMFAPIWPLVMGFKNGTIDSKTYERVYYNLLSGRASDPAFKDAVQKVLAMDSVTFVCFCPPGAFCHRVLLAKYLETLGAKYMGER